MRMNKTEYVNRIEKALVGKVSAQELSDTVAYYRDYIDMEIRKGRSEEDVLGQLGDPRLLAKSIITAKESGQKSGSLDEENCGTEQHCETERGGSYHIPLPILILIIFLILFTILGAFLSLVRLLLPVVLPVAVVIMIVSWIKRRTNK